MNSHTIAMAAMDEASRLYLMALEKFLSELDKSMSTKAKVIVDLPPEEEEILHRELYVMDDDQTRKPIASIIVRMSELKITIELIDRRYKCNLCYDMGFTTNLSIGRDGSYTPEHWPCSCSIFEEET